MGGGGKVGDEDGSNSVGAVDSLQGSCLDGDAI